MYRPSGENRAASSLCGVANSGFTVRSRSSVIVHRSSALPERDEDFVRADARARDEQSAVRYC